MTEEREHHPTDLSTAFMALPPMLQLGLMMVAHGTRNFDAGDWLWVAVRSSGDRDERPADQRIRWMIGILAQAGSGLSDFERSQAAAVLDSLPFSDDMP